MAKSILIICVGLILLNPKIDIAKNTADTTILSNKQKFIEVAWVFNAALLKTARATVSYNFTKAPILAMLHLGYQPGIWDEYYDERVFIDLVPDFKFNAGYGYLIGLGMYYRVIDDAKFKNNSFLAIGVLTEHRENYSSISQHFKLKSAIYLSSIIHLSFGKRIGIDLRHDIGYKQGYNYYESCNCKETMNPLAIGLGISIGYTFGFKTN
jgi:hypothetical protein